jgi:hypothetical protein
MEDRRGEAEAVAVPACVAVGRCRGRVLGWGKTSRAVTMTVFRCMCDCHDAGMWGAIVTDPIEAVTACKSCQDNHVAALDHKPPEGWTPQSDATGDEGRES